MTVTSPTLIVNTNICENNIRFMLEKATRNNCRFRPHFKTHQSLFIGELYRKLGIREITVSSIKMAEYFIKDDWKDVTIAFPHNCLETEKINRLAKEATINLCIESIETMKHLCEKIKTRVNFFLKIDIGYHRTGIKPDNIDLIRNLLNMADENRYIFFKGFLGHCGHTYNFDKTEEILKIHNSSIAILKDLKNKFIKTYPHLEISTGDTPSCSRIEDFKGVDEIRPGNHIFYDYFQFKRGNCTMDKVAVVMACPVVAKHNDKAIIHGGAVHFSKDTYTENGANHFGVVVSGPDNTYNQIVPDMFVTSLSQEHGTVSGNKDYIRKLKIGELLYVIPVHSCLTANLQDFYVDTDNQIIDKI